MRCLLEVTARYGTNVTVTAAFTTHECKYVINMTVTQLLHQPLHIYKIYKIYTLKHKKRSDMFRS